MWDIIIKKYCRRPCRTLRRETVLRMKKDFLLGARDGLPVCLGYLAVSFGVGISAVSGGLNWWTAVIMSLTNLTSAGQVAGIGIIAAGGSFIEMALTQLLINCRYSLMALSLSQNLSADFGTAHRFAASYGITDEIFGIASSRSVPVTPAYMYGLISVSAAGWTLGTFLGAFCGDILPGAVVSSLGILIYGMFIAIIVPPAKKSRPVLAAVLLAAGSSCVIYFFLKSISAGFAVIISAGLSAAVTAVAAPVPEAGEDET